MTDELRKLTKKDVPWKWEKCQQKAFEMLKEQLYENAVLNYFDITLTTVVICDASPVGLRAILVQYEKDDETRKERPKVISYSSSSLTQTEKRYSQIEKEVLAIHFGCMKFELFVLGPQRNRVHSV